MTHIDRSENRSAQQRFEVLYDRHHSRLRAYCRRRVATERVDDVVAETFLTAWRRIDVVPDGEAALLWLYRVAYRVVGHNWRGNERRRRLGSRAAGIRHLAAASPEEQVVDSDDIRRALAAAAQLNERDAEVLRLMCWERLSRAEIAAVLELDPNTVGQRIHRAKKNLTRNFERLESHRPERTPAAQKGGMS